MPNWIINVSGKLEKETLCSYVISCLPSKLRKVAASDHYYTAKIPVFKSLVDHEAIKASAEDLINMLSSSAEIFADKKPKIELSEDYEVVVKAPANDIDLKRWIKQLTNPECTIFTCNTTLKTCLSSISKIDLSDYGSAKVNGAEKIEIAQSKSFAQVSNQR